MFLYLSIKLKIGNQGMFVLSKSTLVLKPTSKEVSSKTIICLLCGSVYPAVSAFYYVFLVVVLPHAHAALILAYSRP